jgi:NAD dependent epimerase/dehydratase family enzyme
MVLGVEPGSVFRVLRRLARLGLGGPMADGRQYVSWIHEMDFCAAVERLIGNDDLAGPFNLAAPNPVPNREMMQLFREVCGTPFGLPARRWMLEIGALLMGTETELVIKSRRVVPGRLKAAGFEFQYPDLKSALSELEKRYRKQSG